jgi:hypothetical protein
VEGLLLHGLMQHGLVGATDAIELVYAAQPAIRQH